MTSRISASAATHRESARGRGTGRFGNQNAAGAPAAISSDVLDDLARQQRVARAAALERQLFAFYAEPPVSPPKECVLMLEADAPDWTPRQDLTSFPTYADSFEGQKPELATAWHPTRNGVLLPSDLDAHSRELVYWKCRWCGRCWVESPHRFGTQAASTCTACKALPPREPEPVWEVIEPDPQLAAYAASRA